MNIQVVDNVHPLIKAVAEAIADPPSCFFIRTTDFLHWTIFLNTDCKNDYDEKNIKTIATYIDHEKAEDDCEKLNNYNLAKYALKAHSDYVKANSIDVLEYHNIIKEI